MMNFKYSTLALLTVTAFIAGAIITIEFLPPPGQTTVLGHPPCQCRCSPKIYLVAPPQEEEEGEEEIPKIPPETTPNVSSCHSPRLWPAMKGERK